MMTDCELQRVQCKDGRDWGEVSDWVKFGVVQQSKKLKKMGN